MVEVGNEGHGKHVTLSLPSAGYLGIVASTVIFITGWVAGYITFKSDMRTIVDINEINILNLTKANESLNVRVASLIQESTVSSQVLQNRIIVIESDIKYLKETITEIRNVTVPGAQRR